MSDVEALDAGLGPLIDEFVADRDVIGRRYRLSHSRTRRERMTRLLEDWRRRVRALPTELPRTAGFDRILFENHLASSLRTLEREAEEAARFHAALPFGETIVALDEARAAMIPVDPETAGATLTALALAIETAAPPAGDAPVAAWLGELREAIDRWTAFYSGYDPALDWWIRQPLGRVAEGLKTLVERTEAAERESETIPGRPVGRAAIEEDLAFAMIPYSPEELIAIGEREYAWCLNEMRVAAREMGFGDDWKAAVERVKGSALPPGEQPAMVRGLALEAIEYVRELVTIPELAEEVWAMEMMPAERQKVSPFFLGGETIIVSYPTDAMTHEEKRMSMRGNNPDFSRATVQHELIPGHHLQMYMTERFRPYRRLFSTPFWIEGWTLYWELLLWRLGFPRTPEERIGMLFWRMHRCVRISFSLRFHLGEMTTAECVETLVDRVGHERANAEGEVKRSFNGMYPPLYQAAYMIGGLQFEALERELIGGGRMSHREFHDAILRENEMPPAVMRAILRRDPPQTFQTGAWRFDEREKFV